MQKVTSMFDYKVLSAKDMGIYSWSLNVFFSFFVLLFGGNH